MACCMSVTAKYDDETWAKQLVRDVILEHKVVLFVDSNNSTCGKLRKIFEEDIKVEIHVVEIDKMDYKPIERELERVTGCRIVSRYIAIAIAIAMCMLSVNYCNSYYNYSNGYVVYLLCCKCVAV